MHAPPGGACAVRVLNCTTVFGNSKQENLRRGKLRQVPNPLITR
jgi:hypothetical protein